MDPQEDTSDMLDFGLFDCGLDEFYLPEPSIANPHRSSSMQHDAIIPNYRESEAPMPTTTTSLIRMFRSKTHFNSQSIVPISNDIELEAVPECGIEAMTFQQSDQIYLHQHKRTTKEHAYVSVLRMEEWYRKKQNRDGRSYLKPIDKAQLIGETGLSAKQISVWVANRRNRKGR
eukprot:m.204044 g.204044  ORF g.204044 m.204044 type:complete len:174 (-) comp17083_c0_seq1:6877-7398(-)